MAFKIRRVLILPKVSGVGGMVSFAAKFTAGLEQRGISYTSDPADEPYDAVLVIGGTWRHLVALRTARKKGMRVVQRLDGMNWLQRKTSTGVRHWLRAETGNIALDYIRERLATRLVYQSHFVQEWWVRANGDTRQPAKVIYNGVDLDIFSPKGKEKPPKDRVRILMVEGNLQGGYELGLITGVALAEGLAEQSGQPVELAIAGRVAPEVQKKWSQASKVDIDWLGVVPNQDIPALNRGAHLLYSSDINAACPNSVIEAMACGLPVLAFDTGALNELVNAQAGRVVHYGGDPWQLDPPDTEALIRGGLAILSDQKALRAGARKRALAFGVDGMVEAYLEVLGG